MVARQHHSPRGRQPGGTASGSSRTRSSISSTSSATGRPPQVARTQVSAGRADGSHRTAAPASEPAGTNRSRTATTPRTARCSVGTRLSPLVDATSTTSDRPHSVPRFRLPGSSRLATHRGRPSRRAASIRPAICGRGDYFVHAAGSGGLRHAKHHRGVAVLGNADSAGLPNRHNPSAPVPPHSRSAPHPRPVGKNAGNRPEQGVSGGAHSPDGRFLAEANGRPFRPRVDPHVIVAGAT